jgi:hypothetical protein
MLIGLLISQAAITKGHPFLGDLWQGMSTHLFLNRKAMAGFGLFQVDF